MVEMPSTSSSRNMSSSYIAMKKSMNDSTQICTQTRRRRLSTVSPYDNKLDSSDYRRISGPRGGVIALRSSIDQPNSVYPTKMDRIAILKEQRSLRSLFNKVAVSSSPQSRMARVIKFRSLNIVAKMEGNIIDSTGTGITKRNNANTRFEECKSSKRNSISSRTAKASASLVPISAMKQDESERKAKSIRIHNRSYSSLESLRDQSKIADICRLRYDPLDSKIAGVSSTNFQIVQRNYVTDTIRQRLCETSKLTNVNYVVSDHSTSSAGVFSIQGLKPSNPQWINQDSYIIKENIEVRKDNNAVSVYSVFDGHGQDGHLISNLCATRLPSILSQVNMDPTLACSVLNSEVMNSRIIDCRSSGSTCITAMTQRESICIVNLGDSRCVLGRLSQNADNDFPESMYEAVALSKDHKPDRHDERIRIESFGGNVSSKQIIIGNNSLGPVKIPLGPARVWYNLSPGVTMGLAMSRSIGDSKAHMVGVSNTPEVTTHIINRAFDKFLILASDGIWDVLSNQEAVMIVGKSISSASDSWDPMKSAQCLANFARDKWNQSSPTRDDITAMVVKL